jgi:hypothetical protein
VTAVTFGAPNIGDTTFAIDFDRRINTRNIEYVADIVPQLPCAGHMPLCAAGAAAAAAADGTAPAADGGSDNAEGEGGEDGDAEADADADYESSSSSGGSVSYAQLGRRLQLEAVDMPLQQDAWSQLSTYRQVNTSTVA